jgi:hypothetical protein
VVTISRLSRKGGGGCPGRHSMLPPCIHMPRGLNDLGEPTRPSGPSSKPRTDQFRAHTSEPCDRPIRYSVPCGDRCVAGRSRIATEARDRTPFGASSSRLQVDGGGTVAILPSPSPARRMVVRPQEYCPPRTAWSQRRRRWGSTPFVPHHQCATFQSSHRSFPPIDPLPVTAARRR